MEKKDKVWAILVHLSMNMWMHHYNKLEMVFDDAFWDYILDESVKTGINMIVLDVGDGIQYASHPEISIDGAWSRKRVREEVARCKALGIDLIPKLNFATPHDMWLGEYAKMISTKTYYQVANDLIKEVYNLFDKPAYIHLGMDEEDARHVAKHELAIYRQGELFWHDLNFLLDCVADTGAKPMLWSCPLYRHMEEYKAHVGVEDAILSPWYYNAFRKEHWTPVESRAEYVAYYNEGEYAKMGIRFVEEDPYLVNFRKVTPPAIAEGYKLFPCASVFNRCDWNTSDLVEYFKENTPDDQLLGFITAPWVSTTYKNPRAKQFYEESFRFLKEAKEKFYK